MCKRAKSPLPHRPRGRVHRVAAASAQSGVMLLEALIAILIFSVGLLGIVGLQAKAVSQVSDARFRSEAALLANQLVASMRTQINNTLTVDQNIAALQANFNGSSACAGGTSGYCNFVSTVSANLPMGSHHIAPAPSVAVDNTGAATITIYWRSPEDDTAKNTAVAPHQYVTVAQIRQQ